MGRKSAYLSGFATLYPIMIFCRLSRLLCQETCSGCYLVFLLSTLIPPYTCLSRTHVHFQSSL